MKTLPKLHFVTLVWNKPYVDLFNEVFLPSQCTKGNLLYLKEKKCDGIYRIFTTKEDRTAIETSAYFSKLQECISVEFVEVILTPSFSIYQEMVIHHQKAMQEASIEDAAIIFLMPDMVFAEGTFASWINRLEKGKRVILLTSLRLNREDFVSEFLQKKKISYAPRELVTMALKHLHERIRFSFWDKKRFSSWPSILGWKVKENELLVHSFHPHPILVWMENRNMELSNTIDDGFFEKACPSIEKWDFITDSDECITFELTPKEEIYQNSNYFEKNRCFPIRSIYSISLWARKYTKKCHRNLVQIPFYLHASDGDKERLAAEKVAKSIIDTVLRHVEKPSLFAYLAFMGIKLRNKGYRLIEKVLFFFTSHCN
jgi:hypothetical protein